MAYVNQVGGNDDLIFDGRSSVFDREGRLVAARKGFRRRHPGGGPGDRRQAQSSAPWPKMISKPKPKSGTRWCWESAITSRKTRFSKVLLGLSGGIDSALTAAIAAEAVGPENVLGVLMPSRYSSGGSVDDSVELARNLGIQTLTLPISDIMHDL